MVGVNVVGLRWKDNILNMLENKFDYFLNAVHYCMWLSERKFGKFMEKMIDLLFAPIQKYLFTKSFKEKYYKHLPIEIEATNKYLYDSEQGLSIGGANYEFGYFYSGYSIFLSFVFIGVANRFFEGLPPLLDFLLIALPVIVCYIPAYSAVFSNDRYLKYFKQFEKENEHWHKKWRKITVLFIIGSVVSTIMGFMVMWGIEHLL